MCLQIHRHAALIKAGKPHFLVMSDIMATFSKAISQKMATGSTVFQRKSVVI